MSAPGSSPTDADPFAGVTTPTALSQRIMEAIRASGPITFARFMERALYEPELGYYRSGRPTVGREGDFLTSPEVHAVFGYAVGATAVSVWEGMGEPASFQVAEVEPGSGALMSDLFAYVDARSPGLAAAIGGVMVEPSPEATADQRRRLGGLGTRIAWRTDPLEPESVRGLIVANELLDAQPVHRLRWEPSGWRELHVGVDGTAGLHDVAGAISDAALLEPLEGREGSEGQVVEVSPRAAAITGELAEALEEGMLLLFDYGYARERLYASWRREGTLMTFRRHTPGEDPYRHVGEQDLTCHVDLDAVEAAAVQAGLTPYPRVSQAEWLAAAGALSGELPSGGAAAELETYLSRRRGSETLSDPAGLGRIQVMAFGRGGATVAPGLETR